MTEAAVQEFDIAIIGSGPGGYKAAVSASRLGKKVAIIERGLAGGTCLNQGCVPKESLMRVARLIDELNAHQGFGLNGSMSGDFAQAVDNKNSVIKKIRSGLTPWLRQLGIRIIEGEASFIDSQNLLVISNAESGLTRQQIRASRIIIATGARPRDLASCPGNGDTILNSQDFMFNLKQAPRTLLCVGGGAIGTEMAYLMHQFGTKVTILDQADRLLDKPCIPTRASNTIERKFKKLGVEIKRNTTVSKTVVNDYSVCVTFSDGTEAEFDKLLVAVGRQANTESLALENAGIQLDADGFIRTNEFLETSCKGVYAIGDVKRGPMTANAAFHDAKIAASNAVVGNTSVVNYNRVPIVIDTVLPIASVGLTEERAESAGFEPEVARINLAGSTKAHIQKDSEGYIEVVHDEETGQLLGGSIVGPQAGEMIHMLTAACQSNRGLWFFTDISYSHPSWNEELENAIHGCVSSFSTSSAEIFRPGIYAPG